ncbi:hypothetical protein F5Y04DRAFT_279907 [Hypomontagnella monticulosa]|nr:hypothetical protein F5Y04DRAFT_279907 [Hypomontagnella monticulosa]
MPRRLSTESKLSPSTPYQLYLPLPPPPSLPPPSPPPPSPYQDRIFNIESSRAGAFSRFGRLPPRIREMIWCHYFLQDRLHNPFQPHIYVIHTRPGKFKRASWETAVLRGTFADIHYAANPLINRETYRVAESMKLRFHEWLYIFPDLLPPYPGSFNGYQNPVPHLTPIDWDKDLLYIAVNSHETWDALGACVEVPWRARIKNIAVLVSEDEALPWHWLRSTSDLAGLRQLLVVVTPPHPLRSSLPRDRFGFVDLLEFIADLVHNDQRDADEWPSQATITFIVKFHKFIEESIDYEYDHLPIRRVVDVDCRNGRIYHEETRTCV